MSTAKPDPWSGNHATGAWRRSRANSWCGTPRTHMSRSVRSTAPIVEDSLAPNEPSGNGASRARGGWAGCGSSSSGTTTLTRPVSSPTRSRGAGASFPFTCSPMTGRCPRWPAWTMSWCSAPSARLTTPTPGSRPNWTGCARPTRRACPSWASVSAPRRCAPRWAAGSRRWDTPRSAGGWSSRPPPSWSRPVRGWSSTTTAACRLPPPPCWPATTWPRRRFASAGTLRSSSTPRSTAPSSSAGWTRTRTPTPPRSGSTPISSWPIPSARSPPRGSGPASWSPRLCAFPGAFPGAFPAALPGTFPAYHPLRLGRSGPVTACIPPRPTSRSAPRPPPATSGATR